MGDRVLIQMKDSRDKVSPVCYLHHGGTDAPALIKETAVLMKLCGEDMRHAFARLVGIAHERGDGPLGLAVWNAPDLLNQGDSHGDAGIYIVHCGTWEVDAFGGYGVPFSVTGKPSWSEVPDWARWLAQDKDGTWSFYSHKPGRSVARWVAVGCKRMGQMAVKGVVLNDWTMSLEERPAPAADQEKAQEPKTVLDMSAARVAAGLEATALNLCYDGYALGTASRLNGLSAASRDLLARYLSGAQTNTDHISLCDLANRIRTGQPLD